MPFSQRILLEISPLQLGAIIVFCAAAFSIAGILLMRKAVHHRTLKVHNDIAGPIFSTLGVTYAVLLGFVVVVTWQGFDRSRLNAEKEANCLLAMYMGTESYAEPFKHEIRAFLQKYAKIVINDEWKAIGRGEESKEANLAVDKISKLYAAYLSKNKTDEIFFESSVNKLNDLYELRSNRILDAKTGVHSILWFVLISGGVITVVFSFFFGSENLKSQIVMTVLLAVLIALILFTIMELDYPFTGSVSIKPDAFENVLLSQ